MLDKLAARPFWPHLRAALVALHMVAVFVLAIPDAAGPASRRSAWKQETVQGELDLWAQRLTAAGMPYTREELEERMWQIAKGWTRFTMAVRRPFMPYSLYCGVRERWRMFVAPHRYPARLHIEVHENGEWRPIYVTRSPEYDWRGHQFDQSRFRAMMFRYAWKEYKGAYQHLAKWVARQVAVEFPDADRVRLRLYGYRTPTPEEVKEDRIPKGEFRQKVVLKLEDYR